MATNAESFVSMALTDFHDHPGTIIDQSQQAPVVLTKHKRHDLLPVFWTAWSCDLLPVFWTALRWKIPVMVEGQGSGASDEEVEVFGGADRLRAEAGRGR
ncbi:hypothetical protein ACTHQV_18155, partial [Sphingomonas sp. SAFR-052]